MYVSLLAPLGIVPREPADYRLVLPIGADDHARMAAWRTGHGLAAGGYLVCAPGTTRPQKHWVAERWAPALAALHRRHGLPAVLVGGPSEQALADTIVAGATSPVVSAVGATSIKETGALFAAAALTVSVDTGPMHMAVAAGCPTLALFGSTRPRLFDDGSRYTCLHRRFACSPCDRRPICRDYDCLRAITPGDVVRAADHLLGER
jgi:heptosyltransferase-1